MMFLIFSIVMPKCGQKSCPSQINNETFLGLMGLDALDELRLAKVENYYINVLIMRIQHMIL